ncbi:hypothetical protein [Streptomyces sp. NPDC127084]|uniref:hypothetical protein n=1 Tax=Streptomyces sp. NPDC127084 TaxID=3347133 RepID=UPI003667BC66
MKSIFLCLSSVAPSGPDVMMTQPFRHRDHIYGNALTWASVPVHRTENGSDEALFPNFRAVTAMGGLPASGSSPNE